MLVDKVEQKENSQAAQLQIILQKDLMKKKYNTKFIFDKIKNSNCQIVATNYLLSHHPKWIGCTPLYFAASDRKSEALEILMNNGIDFTIKNKNGSTVLHQYIESKPSSISNYLIADNIVKLFTSAHVKFNNFENPVNDSGLSHFHIACAVNDIEAVKGFLQHGVSVDHIVKTDSSLFPGFSPLHFAGKSCAVGVAEVLLSHGANIHQKDAKGMTPIHTMLKKRLKLANQPFIFKNQKYSSEQMVELFVDKLSNDGTQILDNWGLTLLHIVCAIEEFDVAKNVLENFENIGDALSMDSPLWAGYTALHFAALCNIDNVKLLLKKGADISLKDAKGVTPLDICIKKYGNEEIYGVLSLSQIYKNILLSDGRTKLTDLVFAMRRSDFFNIFLKKLSKNFSICDSPLWSGYSPMHLAVVFSKELFSDSKNEQETNALILKNLYEQNPNMLHSQDIHGHTPLHLAFQLNKTSVLEQLLKYLEAYPNLVDKVNEDGLSYVHIASSENKTHILKRLLLKGSNVNALYKGRFIDTTVNSDSTPLHLAVVDDSFEAAYVLIKFGADLYAKDGNGFTPIHLLISTLKTKMIHTVLKLRNLEDCVVSGIGLSHLHVACRCDKSDYAELLLSKGANINAVINYKPEQGSILSFLDEYAGQTPLLIAYKKGHISTFMMLLQRGADIFVEYTQGMALIYRILECGSIVYFDAILEYLKKNQVLQNRLKSETRMTKLHIACLAGDVNNIESLLSEGAEVNAQILHDSPIFQGCTALHFVVDYKRNYNDEDESKVIKLLLKSGANVTLQNKEYKTVVHSAYKWFIDNVYPEQWNYDRVDMLLAAQRDFSLNPVSGDGISHFLIACHLCNDQIVKKFLDCGNIDINQPIDYFHKELPGYSALHLAVGINVELCGISKLLKTTDFLLNYGADVHAEDNYGDTPLHECIRCGHLDVFERLIRNGSNVNLRNICGHTPLDKYLESANPSIEGVKILLRFECHLNSFDAITGRGFLGGMVAILPFQEIQEFISTTAVNFKQEMEMDNFSRTIIHNIVSVDPPAILTNHQYANLIDQISDFGCDIDNKDNLGNTALHMAAKFHNWKAISGLLMTGTDINITNDNGQTAFYYASNTYSKCDCPDSSSDSEDEGEGDEDKKACRHTRSLKILAIHVKKLQLCGIFANKQNEDLSSKAVEKIGNKNGWSEKFCEELESIKNTRIGSHLLTLHDFLSDIGAVADYPMMSQLKRNDINEFFSSSNSENFQNKFPEVAEILKLQYRKAIARPQLVELAKDAMTSLIDFHFPDLCSHAILVLLSNSDLQNLISSGI